MRWCVWVFQGACSVLVFVLFLSSSDVWVKVGVGVVVGRGRRRGGMFFGDT